MAELFSQSTISSYRAHFATPSMYYSKVHKLEELTDGRGGRENILKNNELSFSLGT